MKKKPTKKAAPATVAPARSSRTAPGVKVRALQDLQYDHKYYRRDDVLTVPASYFEGDLEARHREVFEEVDPRTPAKITSSNRSLREETLGGRTTPGQQTDVDVPTGEADVLGELK